MTTWDPGAGGADLLSSGDERSPWSGRLRTTAVAVMCLVGGAFLGTQLDDAGSPIATLMASPPAALTGGVVAPLDGGVDVGVQPHRFQVSLFNPGEQSVRVHVVGLAGRNTTVVADAGVDLAPRSWADATFSLPELCDEPSLPPATALRVRVVGPDSAGEQQVKLADSATAIRDDRKLECLDPTSLDRAQFTGLWYVEESRGRWWDFAGTALWRFTRDGRFTFDPAGLMFHEGNQGFLGTYQLDGDRLRLRADGGYACPVGFTEVWTTTLLTEDRLRLDVERSDEGYCNSPPGERRILRRLVSGSGLPSVESSRATAER